MVALAALLTLNTPTFEEITKKSLDPFDLSKYGTVEYRMRFEGPEAPASVGVTLRFSKGAHGSVFEGLRDGHKIMRVMNDGKTVSVQATGAGLQCLVPADFKRPIDVAMMRVRPDGKSMKVTFLGEPSGNGFEGYTWKNKGDRIDVMDGVDCRHLTYAGTKKDSPEITIECWVDKKTSAFRFMRYKFEEASISVATSFTPNPLPLPKGPLAKMSFKGYESVPLSVVREKAAAMWVAVEEAEEK